MVTIRLSPPASTPWFDASGVRVQDGMPSCTFCCTPQALPLGDDVTRIEICWASPGVVRAPNVGVLAQRKLIVNDGFTVQGWVTTGWLGFGLAIEKTSSFTRFALLRLVRTMLPVANSVVSTRAVEPTGGVWTKTLTCWGSSGTFGTWWLSTVA